MNRAKNAGDGGRPVRELLDPGFRDRLCPAAAEFMAPMLATLTGTYFSDSGWLFERKLDGVRALAVRDEAGTRLYSRTHHAMSQTYPELVEALDTRVPAGSVVDGEIVAFDGEQTSFSRLQARIGLTTPAKIRETGVEVFLYLFDALVLQGHDVTRLPLRERKRLLAEAVDFTDPVRLSEHRDTDGEAYLREACQRGWEGLIAKRADAPYHPGARSKDWLKFKCTHEQELVVAGYTDPSGSRAGFGALLLGYYEGDDLRYAGKVGTGFTDRTLRTLRALFDDLATSSCPFADPVRERGAHWVRPELVAQVGFAEWTRDHHLRHPRFLGLREDKPAAEVIRERPAAPDTQGFKGAGGASGDQPGTSPASWDGPTDDELAQLDSLKTKGRWNIGGREVALTNLDKVLFPARTGEVDEERPAVTKRDLIRYYAQVAPFLLPYLADRPVNLHRFPNGIDNAGFWQKQVPDHAPDWLTRWNNAGKTQHTEQYAILDSPASLVWMANYAALELHPWTSRLPDVREPTWALIDIDPGTDTTFAHTLQLARLYRTALEHLQVRAAAKVTGQRGIQIWVPIQPGYTFDDTRAWVEQVSRAVGTTLPKLVSWEWLTDRRRGLARLDYTQNALNKTLVAPFSPRPAAGAPVSMPITWDELDDPDLRPDRWTINTAPDRLLQSGDPMAALIGHHQRLPTI
jgi:bifunctional non-homologous end joining protein LigD